MSKHRIRWSWIILSVIGICFFVLGFSGFHNLFLTTGEQKSIADIVYLTIQLFTMESGAVEGAVPWSLEIARFGAPLLTASAIIGAFLGIFSFEIRRFILKIRGGHVIICGLGRKGSRLVEELYNAGDRIVVIEPNENNPGLGRCRELNIVVIRGRADEEWSLDRAHLTTASRLVATTGDDGVNIETVIRADRLLQGNKKRNGPLHFIAHISDPALHQLIKRHEIFRRSDDNIDLAIVNVYEVGARLMLEKSGVFDSPTESGKIRVGLVGLGTFGEAVLRRLLRDAWLRKQMGTHSDSELELVIIDSEATRKEPWFRKRYSEFLEGVTVNFLDRDVRSPEFAGPLLSVTRPNEEFSVFFVCFDNDSLATLASLRVRERFGPNLPIVVRMAEEFGFANLLREQGSLNDTMNAMHPIGFLDIACMRDLFLGGDVEIMARAIHDFYVKSCREAGLTEKDRPLSVPWQLLDDDHRESSRSQVKDLRRILGDAGLDLKASPDRRIELFELPPEILIQLAQNEHHRWCVEKKSEGWRFGEARNDARKIHPLLITWDQLSTEERERNLQTSRQLPAILAHADFELAQRDSSGDQK